MNFRIVVVVIIYAFVVVFLPRQHDVERFLDQARTLDPTTAIIISGIAAALAGIGSFFLWRKPRGLMYTQPTRILHVIHMGLIGILFAGAYDIFIWLSGESTDIVNLILIPVAFMVAESVYLLLEWRLNRPPED